MVFEALGVPVLGHCLPKPSIDISRAMGVPLSWFGFLGVRHVWIYLDTHEDFFEVLRGLGKPMMNTAGSTSTQIGSLTVDHSLSILQAQRGKLRLLHDTSSEIGLITMLGYVPMARRILFSIVDLSQSLPSSITRIIRIRTIINLQNLIINQNLIITDA